MGPTARAERAAARRLPAAAEARSPHLRDRARLVRRLHIDHFTNKYQPAARLPLPTLTFCNNAIVSLIALLLTRAPRLRPAPLRRGVAARRAAVGLCTALDIGFSNWSLRHISVAFHTMIEATIPGCLPLRPAAPPRAAVAAARDGGGAGVRRHRAGERRAVAAPRPRQRLLSGLALGLVSGAFAGLRWALSQLLVQGGELSRRASPLATILRISPVCAAAGLGLSVSFEGLFSSTRRFCTPTSRPSSSRTSPPSPPSSSCSSSPSLRSSASPRRSRCPSSGF